MDNPGNVDAAQPNEPQAQPAPPAVAASFANFLSPAARDAQAQNPYQIGQVVEADDGTPIVYGIEIPRTEWRLFETLPKFDIRNGDISDVQSLVIKATIPQEHHWVPIVGLEPEAHADMIDGYVKSHLATSPPALAQNLARKRAIVLGTIRAVATAFFRLTTADLIPGERADPLLSARRDANDRIVYAITGHATPAQRQVLSAPLNLDNTERAVVCALVKCGLGVIPMQGYSLIMTNHHYLSDAGSQARKVYAVAEKAYWKSADVAAWFTDNHDEIADWAWHKATHPVHMQIKENAAMDVTMPLKLNKANAGACASRLPALETQLRSANSYITLFATVAPLFGIAGGTIEFATFQALVDGVKTLPVVGGVADRLNAVPEQYRARITSRAEGVSVVGDVVRNNADTAAMCYGFYCALTDASAMSGAAAGTDSLKSSFSLGKLRTQSHASYVGGMEMFRDYQYVRNRQRETGQWVAPNIVIM